MKSTKNIQNSDALKGFLFRAYNECCYKNVGQALPDNKENFVENNNCVVGPEQQLLRTSALLNDSPSSALTGHLPPHGEVSHFNAPSTWRERAECASTGVRGKIARGFTLIELLVVVLIIGILAAVALPQYQVAVKKSRFATYRTLAESIAKAVHIYYLSNGNWPDSFEGLDVDMPAGMTTGECLHGTAVYTDSMYCCLTRPALNATNGTIFCGNKTKYDFVYAFCSRTPQAEAWG